MAEKNEETPENVQEEVEQAAAGDAPAADEATPTVEPGEGDEAIPAADEPADHTHHVGLRGAVEAGGRQIPWRARRASSARSLR